MSERQEHSVETARAAAERGALAAWVVEFLGSPGSDNAALGELLSDPPRSWFGPVRLPIDELHRLAGPSDQPVLCAWDEEDWRDDVEDMARAIEEGWVPPPVIVSWKHGELVLEDGNHRVEAHRRAGHQEVWSVVGFATREQRAGWSPPAVARGRQGRAGAGGRALDGDRS